MEDTEFVIGDIVHLKSGSPDMTVIEIGGGDVRCVFWQPNGMKEFEVTASALKRNAVVVPTPTPAPAPSPSPSPAPAAT